MVALFGINVLEEVSFLDIHNKVQKVFFGTLYIPPKVTTPYLENLNFYCIQKNIKS